LESRFGLITSQQSYLSLCHASTSLDGSSVNGFNTDVADVKGERRPAEGYDRHDRPLEEGSLKLALSPRGTRGVELPRVVRPVVKALGSIGGLMFRLGVKIQGRPLLRLTNVGARTGKSRRTVLGWFPSESDQSWFIVASNAGSARHPGWAYNLAANPEEATIDLGDGGFGVDVGLLHGGDRQSVWDRVVEMAPGYGAYLEKTDREIPIFRLTRR
jgi:deazaflavin-dependent oxidoreductase (nitroreductase family)